MIAIACPNGPAEKFTFVQIWTVSPSPAKNWYIIMSDLLNTSHSEGPNFNPCHSRFQNFSNWRVPLHTATQYFQTYTDTWQHPSGIAHCRQHHNGFHWSSREVSSHNIAKSWISDIFFTFYFSREGRQKIIAKHNTKCSRSPLISTLKGPLKVS